MNNIGQGMDEKGIFTGVILIVAGLVMLFTAEGIGLSLFGSIDLPDWAPNALGWFALALGLLAVLTSLNNKKCLDCNAVLKNGQMALTPDDPDLVVAAIKNQDKEGLRQIPVAEEEKNATVFRLDYCPQCMEVAVVTIYARKEWKQTVLEENLAITGPEVASLLEYLKDSGRVDRP
jgi:hypothetical protein